MDKVVDNSGLIIIVVVLLKVVKELDLVLITEGDVFFIKSGVIVVEGMVVCNISMGVEFLKHLWTAHDELCLITA